ncbi:LexA/Signal peptidase [Polyporus arcularius HHB13444]|uniref:LexA/Signal peptidase n=1 Tax=Polyporus arcularius HHB13444 TaxID=1314778 RepID=A0A5C3PU10_9APHY|nr:LexA/Signal peptidase [Polyporus arcularius HHB13444]
MAIGLLTRLWSSIRNTAQNPKVLIQQLPYRGLQFANFLCALHLFADHVATISSVQGPSMIPTMANEGEIALELKWINVHKLARGDLITYASPLDPSRPVCKRVLGLPGDVVCVDPTGTYAPSTEHVVVPKNHLWVSGDNLAYSRDSRVYGPIPMGLVRGKLYARVWPLRDATVFPSNFDFID